MSDIKAKASQAITEQMAVLESRSDLIAAVRELATAGDIRAAFDSLDAETAKALLMLSVSTLMNCQAVEAIKRQELN